jgi:hypothetical protein
MDAALVLGTGSAIEEHQTYEESPEGEVGAQGSSAEDIVVN